MILEMYEWCYITLILRLCKIPGVKIFHSTNEPPSSHPVYSAGVSLWLLNQFVCFWVGVGGGGVFHFFVLCLVF